MTKRRRKGGGSKPAGTIDGVGRFESRAPSITQMRMFLMVVDEGSFAAAARKIGRATSVVSYSIAKLEAQLGVSLFMRDNTRKPQLTEAGWTVLSKTRTIISDVVSLSARVRGLGRAFEPEVLVALMESFHRRVSSMRLKRSGWLSRPYRCMSALKRPAPSRSLYSLGRLRSALADCFRAKR